MILHERQGFVGWVHERLRLQGVQVNDLEVIRAAKTQSVLEEVNRARLSGDVKFLRANVNAGNSEAVNMRYPDKLHRVIAILTALHQPLDHGPRHRRGLRVRAGLKDLDCAGEGIGSDNAHHSPAGARRYFEERGMRRYPLRALQACGWVPCIQGIKRESKDLAL